MFGPVRLPRARLAVIAFLFLGAFFGSGSGTSGASIVAPPTAPTHAAPLAPAAEDPSRPARVPVAGPVTSAPNVSFAPNRVEGPIMLGIDVLAAENFAPIAGKRVGLFTHRAGVNRFGVSTIDVLRRAPNVKLVELFAPENGLRGDVLSGENFSDFVDRRTGLPVYSLYSKNHQPTKAQLQQIDVFIIDLQDIGVRSYTFVTWMRYAMEACFENGTEVMVLDRPNPLSGLKVDGPILEKDLRSGVGGFCVPYVHGLTIGELAHYAASVPGVLKVSESVRQKGKLTVIPMRGWHRWMRWPETGLTFIPTSPYIPDFAACVGCAMTGLGTQVGGFKSGIGTQYPFRGVFYNGKPVDQILHELQALHLPGLSYRKVSAPKPNGPPAIGIYLEVNDWQDWRPTELNFYLIRLACRWSGTNPFAKANDIDQKMFIKLVGTTEFWNALTHDGPRVNIEAFLAKWKTEDQAWQQSIKKYWLYE